MSSPHTHTCTHSCGLQELTRVAKEDRLKGYEIVKAVHLEAVQFSVEEDLLTPSFKLRRPQLQVGVRACVLGVWVEGGEVPVHRLRCAGRSCTRAD